MNSLRGQLLLFDGKHTEVLERVAVSVAEHPRAIQRLAMIAEKGPDGPIAVAATWVILALLRDRRDTSVDRSVALRLVRVLEHAGHWETRLHVLQTLGQVELAGLLTPSQLRELATMLKATAKDSKPLVRAWSLNLLGLIGGRLPPDLQSQIGRLITQAEERDSASIKARIRRLRHAGGLAWME